MKDGSSSRASVWLDLMDTGWALVDSYGTDKLDDRSLLAVLEDGGEFGSTAAAHADVARLLR